MCRCQIDYTIGKYGNFILFLINIKEKLVQSLSVNKEFSQNITVSMIGLLVRYYNESSSKGLAQTQRQISNRFFHRHY